MLRNLTEASHSLSSFPYASGMFLCVEDRAICSSSHPSADLSLLWSEIRHVDESVESLVLLVVVVKQSGKHKLIIIHRLMTFHHSAFHPSGVGKSSTSLYWLGLRRGVFACVGWQVTLYDPIWQATPCSSDMGFP